MEKIDPFKPEWDDAEWDIYIGNLDILCRKYGLRKQDLSKKAAIFNAFRTDIKRPAGDTIEKIAKTFGTTTEWLLTRNEKTISVGEPAPEYLPHGGYVPDPERVIGASRGSAQWKAFELLSKIYASADQELIDAIFQNLKAFSEAAQRKRENIELKQTVEDLSARLNEVVAQLNQKGLVQLGERRRGGDRREAIDPNRPADKERRDGQDRRKAAPD